MLGFNDDLTSTTAAEASVAEGLMVGRAVLVSGLPALGAAEVGESAGSRSGAGIEEGESPLCRIEDPRMSLNHALTAENLGVMRSAIGICLVAGESEFPTPSQGEQGSESSHLMVVWGGLNADGLSSEAVRPTHLNSRANHNARRPVTRRRHPMASTKQLFASCRGTVRRPVFSCG